MEPCCRPFDFSVYVFFGFLGVLGSNAGSGGAIASSLFNLGSGMTGMTGVGSSMAGMVGNIGGSLSALAGGGSPSVGSSGLGMMGAAGMGSSLGGGGGGGSGGLGGSLSSSLVGFGVGLSGLRGGGLADAGMMSKGSGGGGLGGISGSLGGMSDSRMSSLTGELYRSLGSSLGYDRGGNLDRIGSSYDHGTDRGDAYSKSSENSTVFVKNVGCFFLLSFYVLIEIWNFLWDRCRIGFCQFNVQESKCILKTIEVFIIIQIISQDNLIKLRFY